MPNRNYERGRRFEYRIRDIYQNKGWSVFRSAGSHSAADLICLRAGEVLLIQCQLSSYFPPAKIEQLKEMAKENKCRAMLYWIEKKIIYSRELEY